LTSPLSWFAPKVARIVGSGDEVRTGQIPFTPRAKKTLELALREALALQHTYIGPEHILLGLVREGTGVAASVLLDSDADADRISGSVFRELGLHPAPDYPKLEPMRGDPGSGLDLSRSSHLG
jgi:ATP-dependent Clp protease ATP-binding subunit ClpC